MRAARTKQIIEAIEAGTIKGSDLAYLQATATRHDMLAGAKATSIDPSGAVELVIDWVDEWEGTWIDPDDVNHEWAELYARAKEIIRAVHGGHTA